MYQRFHRSFFSLLKIRQYTYVDEKIESEIKKGRNVSSEFSVSQKERFSFEKASAMVRIAWISSWCEMLRLCWCASWYVWLAKQRYSLSASKCDYYDIKVPTKRWRAQLLTFFTLLCCLGLCCFSFCGRLVHSPSAFISSSAIYFVRWAIFFSFFCMVVSNFTIKLFRRHLEAFHGLGEYDENKARFLQRDLRVAQLANGNGADLVLELKRVLIEGRVIVEEEDDT